MAEPLTALVDLALSLVIISAVLWLAVDTVLWLFSIVASRFGAPAPYGVHGMPANHPERDEVELSDHDRAVLMELDARTEWEQAR